MSLSAANVKGDLTGLDRRIEHSQRVHNNVTCQYYDNDIV